MDNLSLILQIGSPFLYSKNHPVSIPPNNEDLDTARKLSSLLGPHKLIGASAPQIGINSQVFVTQVREPVQGAEKTILRNYFNPTIVYKSEEMIEAYEACGSVLSNGLFGPVLRPKLVQIEAYDETGRKFRLKADGILSRVIQHEIDHLNGILFIEKVSDYRKLLNLEHYLNFAKTSEEQKNSYKITVLELEYLI